MRLHVAPVAHRFGRFVISMIALSAVLSALSGYFYSRAAVKSSKATSAALADQAELFRLNSREVTVWNYMVGRVATAGPMAVATCGNSTKPMRLHGT